MCLKECIARINRHRTGTNFKLYQTDVTFVANVFHSLRSRNDDNGCRSSKLHVVHIMHCRLRAKSQGLKWKMSEIRTVRSYNRIDQALQSGVRTNFRVHVQCCSEHE